MLVAHLQYNENVSKYAYFNAIYGWINVKSKKTTVKYPHYLFERKVLCISE